MNLLAIKGPAILHKMNTRKPPPHIERSLSAHVPKYCKIATRLSKNYEKVLATLHRVKQNFYMVYCSNICHTKINLLCIFTLFQKFNTHCSAKVSQIFNSVEIFNSMSEL